MTRTVTLPFGELPGTGSANPTRREVVVAGTAPVAVAVLAAFWPSALPGVLRGALWSTLLLPIGLLTLYRSERGAVVGLGLSLLVLLFGEVLLPVLFGGPIAWGVVLVGASIAGVGAWTLGAVCEELRTRGRRAVRAAYEDPETGLPKRELLERFLSQHVSAARRGETLSVVLFRVEGLAELERGHGKGAAGSLLGSVGDAIDRNSRGMDLAGRWGDDEILTVLPDTDVDGARTYAARALEKLTGLSAETDDGALVGAGVEVRAGIAGFADGVDGPGELADRARRALDADRGGGGGRVRIFSGR